MAMARAQKPVLLIGGIPGDSTEAILRKVGPVLGDLAVALPDGEAGIRRMWVGAVAMRVWSRHPALELVRKPRGAPGLPEGVPADYDDFWLYRSRPGTKRIVIETLHYPADASASYDIFVRLRREGVIPAGTRFQFGFPFPEDACREFTDNAADLELMVKGYIAALKRDIDTVCGAIPHEDLLLQWEINWETLAIEHGDYLADAPPLDYKVNGDPVERYEGYMADLSRCVPEGVKLGMHFCYGDLHHKHFSNPPDLGTCVRMADAARRSAGRRIDYVHMPVPRERSDDDYYRPLKDLDLGEATLYIGLVHYTDGVAGSLARLRAFKKNYSGPAGIAAECGLGRRPADQSLDELLRIHREVASAV
ncbi:MAG: hypothetical protein HYY36_08430 [Gammaproteobacteria bacterium]|nr:hypothetical protein [Gammaproteobacteria bacterium]